MNPGRSQSRGRLWAGSTIYTSRSRKIHGKKASGTDQRVMANSSHVDSRAKKVWDVDKEDWLKSLDRQTLPPEECREARPSVSID